MSWRLGNENSKNSEIRNMPSLYREAGRASSWLPGAACTFSWSPTGISFYSAGQGKSETHPCSHPLRTSAQLSLLRTLTRVTFERLLCDGLKKKKISMKNYLDHYIISKKTSILSSCTETSLVHHRSDLCSGQLPSFPLRALESSWGQSVMCAPHFSVPVEVLKTLCLPGAGSHLDLPVMGPLEELLRRPCFARAVQGVFPGRAPTCFKCHPQLLFSCSLPLQ